jgi:hypothetical protein
VNSTSTRTTPRWQSKCLFVLALSGLAFFSCANRDQSREESELVSSKKTVVARPIMIWHCTLIRDSFESVRRALDSGIPSHLNIYVSNRWTGGVLDDPKMIEKMKQMIAEARRRGVRTILTRNLWPTYSVKGLDSEILFDAGYYIREIQVLRQERQLYGVDAIGLDIEAYGRDRSPVGRYLQWKHNYKPTQAEQARLQQVIQRVINSTGQVDFLYPAGSLRPYHFFNTIALLGEYRIAESSYYDNQVYMIIQYPYEVFGVYINIVKQEPNTSPARPYYLVPEVFEQADRWSKRKGVFLYPREDKALEVAQALYQYSQTLPVAPVTEEEP